MKDYVLIILKLYIYVCRKINFIKCIIFNVFDGNGWIIFIVVCCLRCILGFIVIGKMIIFYCYYMIGCI